MSNGMTQQQLADRLAMIKEIHDTKYGGKMKRNVRASSERVSQYAKNARDIVSFGNTSDWITTPNETVQKGTDEILSYKNGEVAQSFPDHVWTDAPRYAEEYYGERMRQTTWHDNEWD